jgi:hypothetical protein
VYGGRVQGFEFCLNRNPTRDSRYQIIPNHGNSFKNKQFKCKQRRGNPKSLNSYHLLYLRRDRRQIAEGTRIKKEYKYDSYRLKFIINLLITFAPCLATGYSERTHNNYFYHVIANLLFQYTKKFEGEQVNVNNKSKFFKGIKCGKGVQLTTITDGPACSNEIGA